MLLKLLSIVFFIFRKLTTYPDYYITSEEIEYELERDIKYQVEDKFWEDESKSWDGILDHYHVNVTGKKFRHTSIPQNVKYIILGCFIFGIIIEILQGVITSYRTASYLDIVANTIGVLLAVVIFHVFEKKINVF